MEQAKPAIPTDFTIGEQALLVGSVGWCVKRLRQYIGTTVTVTGLPEYDDLDRKWFYRVRATDGEVFFAAPVTLQKLPPIKREPLGSWSAIPSADRIRAPRRELVTV